MVMTPSKIASILRRLSHTAALPGTPPATAVALQLAAAAIRFLRRRCAATAK